MTTAEAALIRDLATKMTKRKRSTGYISTLFDSPTKLSKP